MPFNYQRSKANNYFFSYDWLTIYDGGSSASPMMGKYCGALIPPSHISSSKDMMVYFVTDSYNGNENGFKMEYNPTGKQNTLIQNDFFKLSLKNIHIVKLTVTLPWVWKKYAIHSCLVPNKRYESLILFWKIFPPADYSITQDTILRIKICNYLKANVFKILFEK